MKFPFTISILLGVCLYGGYGATTAIPSPEKAIKQLEQQQPPAEPEAVATHRHDSHELDNGEGL